MARCRRVGLNVAQAVALAAALTSGLGVLPRVARAQLVPPGACPGVDSRAERRANLASFTAALRAEAEILLDDNLLEVRDLRREIYDVGDLDALPASHPAVIAAEAQLGTFRDILIARDEIDDLLDALEARRGQILLVQNEIELQLQNAAVGSGAEPAIGGILAELSLIGWAGFAVISHQQDTYFRTELASDGSYTIGVELSADELDDGTHYIVLEDHIVRPLTSVEEDRRHPCLAHRRLLDILDAYDQDVRRLEGLYAGLRFQAPVLDLDLPRELGGGRLSEQVRSGSLGLGAFGRMMAYALDETEANILGELDRLEDRDADALAKAPLVRAAVLSSHPEFAAIDCVVGRELTLEDLLLPLAWIAGAVGMVAATFFGAPYVAALIATVLTGLSVAETVAQYRRYQEARRMRHTGAIRPGLVSQELVEREHAAFTRLAVMTLVQVIMTAPQMMRLVSGVTRFARARLLLDAGTLPGARAIDVRSFLAGVESGIDDLVLGVCRR